MNESMNPCQEDITLPVGGIQTGSIWYALARLGVSTMGVLCWGVRADGSLYQKFFVYLSRVWEKTALYAISILEDLLGRHRMDEWEGISLWMDCGPQFRNRILLGYVGYDLLDKYRNLRKTQLHFGAEQHFKSWPDGRFREFSHARKIVPKGVLLCEVEELSEYYATTFKHMAELVNDEVPEEFIVWLPREKASYKVHAMKLRSLPMALGVCHSFSFTRNDWSRVSLLGRGVQLFLSGIDVSSLEQLIQCASCND